MRRRYVFLLLLAFFLSCMTLLLLYQLPPIRDHLAWRVGNLEAQIRRLLNPPEQLVFVPQGGDDPGVVQTHAQATLGARPPSATWTPSPSPTKSKPENAPAPTITPSPTWTPTAIPTPIPSRVILEGIVHEYQQFNNCGPANLAMALSFWGWQGNQNDTRLFLRPNRQVDDKNVMPSEMVAFVEKFTSLRALTRVGGDVDLLRHLIAAGFPVMIEKGHHPPGDWWMGHYLVINGYDDGLGRFITQDSLIGPNLPLAYDEMAARWWRDFNYVYLVIFPPEREAEFLTILGSRYDEKSSYQLAEQRARQEIPNLKGRDLFFAWFNLGSSLVGLEDAPGAAEAYDQAFALYAALSEKDRPYRLMWYQVGPYLAYYYTGRYRDVINLANTTLAWVGKPVLEETYYWRGLAYEALGDLKRAVADLKKAAELNPNFTPAFEALQRLGVSLP